MVSSTGVRRALHKLTAGLQLTAGVLLCIGVKKTKKVSSSQQHHIATDAAHHSSNSINNRADTAAAPADGQELSAEEAGDACVVYRVKLTHTAAATTAITS